MYYVSLYLGASDLRINVKAGLLKNLNQFDQGQSLFVRGQQVHDHCGTPGGLAGLAPKEFPAHPYDAQRQECNERTGDNPPQTSDKENIHSNPLMTATILNQVYYKTAYAPVAALVSRWRTLWILGGTS